MAKPLVRLVYRSKSLILPDDNAALESLLRVSDRNNRRDHISGCLAEPDGNFVSALEGQEAAIDRLMSRLRTDHRHEDMVVLGRWEVPGRIFDGWSMARPDLRPLSEQSFRIIDRTGTAAQVVSVLLDVCRQSDQLY